MRILIGLLFLLHYIMIDVSADVDTDVIKSKVIVGKVKLQCTFTLVVLHGNQVNVKKSSVGCKPKQPKRKKVINLKLSGKLGTYLVSLTINPSKIKSAKFDKYTTTTTKTTTTTTTPTTITTTTTTTITTTTSTTTTTQNTETCSIGYSKVCYPDEDNTCPEGLQIVCQQESDIKRKIRSGCTCLPTFVINQAIKDGTNPFGCEGGCVCLEKDVGQCEFIPTPLVISYFMTDCETSNHPTGANGQRCQLAVDGSYGPHVRSGWENYYSPGHAIWRIEEPATINTVIFWNYPGKKMDHFSVGVEVNGTIVPITNPKINDADAEISPSGRIITSPSSGPFIRVGFPDFVNATGVKIESFVERLDGQITEIWLLYLSGVDMSEDIEGIINTPIPVPVPSPTTTPSPVPAPASVISYFMTDCETSNHPTGANGLRCELAVDGSYGPHVRSGWENYYSPGHAIWRIEEPATINSVIFWTHPGKKMDYFSVGVEVNGTIIPVTKPRISDVDSKVSPSGRIRISPSYGSFIRVGFPDFVNATGVKIESFVERFDGQITEIWLLYLSGVDISEDIEGIVNNL